MNDLTGTKVRVHLNLHRGDWSVTVKGKVVCNVPEITLRDCTFYVCESMRQRVLTLNRRKVHAWAIGTVADRPAQATEPLNYNPYRGGTFTVAGEPVTAVNAINFTLNKRAFVAR